MQEVYNDGSVGKPKPYSKEALEESLQKPGVSKVVVFKPEVGLVIKIGHKYYKVTKKVTGGFFMKATKPRENPIASEFSSLLEENDPGPVKEEVEEIAVALTALVEQMHPGEDLDAFRERVPDWEFPKV